MTLALIALLAWQLDSGAIAAEVSDIAPAWMLAALALTVPQVLISAWRWRLTAREIGLWLPLRVAVREYYLATFLNQVLPGGVLGDATRAWRNARHNRNAPAAVHAVLIERVSGQLALLLVASMALVQSPALRAGLSGALAATGPHLLWIVAALAAIVALLAVGAARVSRRLAHTLARFATNLRRGLFGSRIGLLQLISSLGVVVTYIGVFVISARAIGIDRPVGELWPLAPLVLFAMAVPLSIAGWGIRESAAALVWMAAGLPASEGVAISIVYGLIVLISSLPGLFVLWQRRQATARGDAVTANARSSTDRGRRTDPRPSGVPDKAGAAHDQAWRSRAASPPGARNR